MDLYFDRMNDLRGICAAAILLSHYSAYFTAKIFHWGLALTPAIYLFFILSGISIAYFHIDDDRSFSDMTGFLKKRFTKIFPVYWIYIGLTLLLDRFFNGKILTYHSRSWIDILKSALCFPSGIFEDYPSTLIPPAWFLSYVVFFYLVYAILRYLFGMRIFKWCERIWMLFILMFNIPGGGTLMNKGTWAAYILNINFLAILIGCEIAYLLVDRKVVMWIKKHSSFIWLWIMISVITWFITGMYIDWIKYTVPMQLFGYILPYALAIIWGIVIDRTSGKRCPRWTDSEWTKRCLSYLSKASYSIFLTHFIALQILMMDLGIKGKAWLLYKAATPIILISIGCLGYQFIEKKIRCFMK